MFGERNRIFFNIVFILSFLGLFFANNVQAGTLSCVVETGSCTSGRTAVFRFSGSGSVGGHAQTAGQSTYNNVVCCYNVVGLGTNCSGNYAVVFKMKNTPSNSHVQENNQSGYANNVCISVDSGTVSIAYQAGNCTGYDTTLASLSATTNAHVGPPGLYNINICATGVAPPNITNLNPIEGRVGTNVDITGVRFGASQGTNGKVFFDTTEATVTSWSETLIKVNVPTNVAGTDVQVKVRRDDGFESGTSPFKILPKIYGFNPNPGLLTETAREYALGDFDGLIMVNGDHFGTAGTVTILGRTAMIHSTAEGPCSVGGYTQTSVCLEVPSDIVDNSYTGNIFLTRTATPNDSRTDTYSSLRVLPRILSTSPVNGKGGINDSVIIIGDHLCQNGGTCPSSLDTNNKITFNTTDAIAFSSWTNTAITATVPSGATDGNLVAKSYAYNSNNFSYNIKFKPSTPSNTAPSPGATNQSRTPTLSASAFSDGTDGDAHSAAKWEITDVSGNYGAGQVVWTRTSGAAETTIVVNSTNGTFQNALSGQTQLAAGTTYYWHVQYKDNAGVTSAEWSAFSSETNFITAHDASGISNSTEGTITDGGRLAQTIVVAGVGMGTVSAGNRATCLGTAGTGCIKIGGTGGYTVPDANVSAWTPTSITFTIPAATTGYGGATTAGLIVYNAGNSDSNGLTFYVYPDISVLSVAEAREGDTIVISGTKFGTGTTGGTVMVLGQAATPVADASCDVADGWTETCIKVTIPAAIPDGTDSGHIIVTQGTGSNNKTTNSTDAQAALAMLPRIVSLTTPADAPDSISAWQGSSITINGSHFGAYNATYSRVAINGVTGIDPTSGNWGVSAITVTVPSGATANGSIQATRGDQKTSNSYSTFYVLPKVSSTGSVNGEAREGDAITISGNHLCGTPSGTCTNLPTIRFYNSGQTVDVTANSGATAASAAVTVPLALSDSIDSYNLEVVRSAAGGQDDGKSSANSARNNFSYKILPDVTGTSVKTGFATDNAREYDVNDAAGANNLKDGQIVINGKHFGTAGTVTILSQTATQQVISGVCGGSAYSATCIAVQVPTAISNSLYTGSVAVTRTADSKSDSYSSLRIMPRITQTLPTMGTDGDLVQVIGNHLCDTGGCPMGADRATASNNIKFDAKQALSSDFVESSGGAGVCDGSGAAWAHTEICVRVPAGSFTQPENVVVKYNSVDSDAKYFDLASPYPLPPTSLKQYKTDGVTELAVGTIIGESGETKVWFELSMSAEVPATLYPQIELKKTNTAFDGTNLFEGQGVSYSGTPVSGVTSTLLTIGDGDYHWRARVKRTANGQNYYGNWVSFNGFNSDGNPPSTLADTDFAIDTTAPAITIDCNTATNNIDDISGIVNWSTNELATDQVKYCCDLDENPDKTFCASGCSTSLTGAATYPGSPGPADAISHSLRISGLQPITKYYYQVISRDSLSHETISPASNPFCYFTTTAAKNRITKTVEYFILQKQLPVTLPNSTTENFQVFLGELAPTLRDAYLEVTGVSNGNEDLSISIDVNSSGEKVHTLGSSGETEYFQTIYQIPVGDINIASPFDDVPTNSIDIEMSGPSSVSLLGVKIILTYYYISQ